MILLAPLKATGGITTWARLILRHWPEPIRIIDTSPWGRKPSQALTPWIALLSLISGASVWIRALFFAIVSGETIWSTTSPSIGFRTRDVPFLLLSRAIGVRTILHVHGSLMPGLIGRTGPSQTWATLGLRAASEVVVLDQKTAGAIEVLTGRAPHLMPNFLSGVLATRQSSRSDFSPQVLYVGRVSRDKGSDSLLMLAASLPDGVGLSVVGPVDPAIDAEFAEAAVSLPMTLVGEVASDQVADWMAKSTLLVLPSHHEGFPMVVLEAMAQQLPVITSDVGACRSMLVDGAESAGGVVVTNPLLDEGADFVATTLALLASPQRLAALAGGIRRVENRYTAERVIARMRDIAAGEAT